MNGPVKNDPKKGMDPTEKDNPGTMVSQNSQSKTQ